MKRDYLLPYVPLKYEASDFELECRQLVLDFKKGIGTRSIAFKVIKWINEHYYRSADQLTFMCVPPSSEERYITRYKEFSSLVCAYTGMRNGFDLIHIEGERRPQHQWAKYKHIDDTVKISIDPKIEDAKVLMFDDVINTGKAACSFKRKIEWCGAYVVHGIFLSKVKKYE